MLGTGRPFILEITDSKKALSGYNTFEALEASINSSNPIVKVLNLQKTNKDKFEEIRQGEEKKLKVYVCLVWSQNLLTPSMITKLNEIKDLTVFQKTPIRVMHRRSLMTREKKVLRAKCKKINDHFFELRLVTSAGTYVKEFVHGDFFRTSPSVAEILECKTDILQLDVLGLGWNVDEVYELLDKEIE
jgi:tRNA pseudouridine synthase 10